MHLKEIATQIDSNLIERAKYLFDHCSEMIICPHLVYHAVQCLPSECLTTDLD